MKIMYLLPMFKNTGPSNVVVSLINGIKQQDHEIIICTFLGVGDDYQDVFTEKNIRIIELNGFNFKSLYQLWHLIKTEQVDVLHSHCFLSDIATPFVTLFRKTKTISTIHCDLKADYNKEYGFVKAKLYYALHNLLLPFINQLICVSAGVASALPFKSRVVYNGVPALTLNRKASNTLNLVFAGRLIARKNILFLIDSVIELSKQKAIPVVLHVFGDGEQMPEAKQHVGEYTDIIKLHGFTKDFLNNVPSNAILVNPALAEGMPMAVLEAIAAGIPALLSPIAPHQEIKANIHSGVEIFDCTTDDFISAVLRLIDDQHQVSFNQEQMTDDFNHTFSSQGMADGYMHQYQQLLSRQ